MGFMDKVKSVAKSAAKGALIMASTNYGVVDKGTYKLCKIGMNGAYSKLIFNQLTEIKGEHVIAEDIESFSISGRQPLNNGGDMYFVNLVWKNGDETSEVIVQSDANQGSGLPTAEQRVAAQYKNVEPFVSALATHSNASEESMKTVNIIRRYVGKGPIEK